MRAAAAAILALAAIAVAMFAGLGVLQNVFDDNRDSPRSTYITVATLAYALAATSAVLAARLVSRASTLRLSAVVVTLVLSTLPYNALFGTDVLYALNVIVFASVLLSLVMQRHPS